MWAFSYAMNKVGSQGPLTDGLSPEVLRSGTASLFLSCGGRCPLVLHAVCPLTGNPSRLCQYAHRPSFRRRATWSCAGLAWWGSIRPSPSPPSCHDYKMPVSLCLSGARSAPPRLALALAGISLLSTMCVCASVVPCGVLIALMVYIRPSALMVRCRAVRRSGMMDASGGSARAGLWLCRPSLGSCGARWMSAGRLVILVPG